MRIDEIHEDKDFQARNIKLFADVFLVGVFPYETKRIQGRKLPAIMYEQVLRTVEQKSNELHLRVLDNKIVLVFRDNKPSLGTSGYFALFYHDGGVVVGLTHDIKDY